MLLNSLLEKENKNIMFCFAFRSLNRTLPLRGEDRMRLGNKNKLGIYFVFLSAFTIFGFAEDTHTRERKQKYQFLFCFPLA